MTKTGLIASFVMVLFSAAISHADTICYITKPCLNCTEDGDAGTKTRAYQRHCEDEAAQKGYLFGTFAPSTTTAMCKFTIVFKVDNLDCNKVLGVTN